MDLRTLWVPLVHRLAPTVGPGGAASTLSLLLHADARNMVHVTRYADVREVWEREEDFSVRVYGERMRETTGEFLLGIADRARHDREARVIAQVMRRTDADLVARIAQEETERALEGPRRCGRIDLVKELAEVVSIRMAMRYFGLETPDPAGLLRLFQRASWYIFSFWHDPRMRIAAVTAGAELRSQLARMVAERRARGHPGDDDVLGRMLTMREPFEDGDEGIVRSLAGLCSGTLNAPIGLFVNVVEKLLDLDGERRRAVVALARGPVADIAVRERFRGYLREAGRFGVFPGVLHRYAERTTTIAAGSARAKTIAEGTTVVIWPSLAGLDGDAFERPFAFVPDRPKHRYMGFGHALHHCLGEHLGEVLIEQMARPLLALPGLRRQRGPAGKVCYLSLSEARFPASFGLAFDGPG